MDSYNHIMDTDYGNIVYGGGLPNQLHQNLPTEGILLQNSEPVKDIQYTTRDTIITSNITEHLDVYQQHQLSLGNGQSGQTHIVSVPQLDTINQYIHTTDQKTDEVRAISEQISTPSVVAAAEILSEIIDTKMSDTITNDELDAPITTTALVNEQLQDDKTVVDVKDTEQKTDDVDQDQCRICLSKSNLINIFSYENNSRICDIIMKICTTVKIIEKDYLPHYICTSCLGKVKIADDFKSTCENTDKDLRLRLKRSKNKVRGPGRFILIDCEMSSASDDDRNKDDDEFHISDAIESDADSDASFTLGKRKRTSRPKKRSLRKRGHDARTRSITAKKPEVSKRPTRTSTRNKTPDIKQEPILPDVVFVETAHFSVNEDEEEEEVVQKKVEEPGPKTRRRTQTNHKASTPKSSPNKSSANKSVNKTTPVSTTSTKLRNKPGRKPKGPHKKRAIEEIKIEKPKSDDEDDVALISRKKETVPKPPKERPCPYCGLVLPSNQKLREHKKSHVGEKPLTCNICNKAFKQKVSLEAHIQKHKEDDSKTCKPCDKQFASKLELRKHLQTVHEDEYTFECDKCKRTFTTKTRLEKHKEGKCPGFDTTTRKKNDVEVAVHLGRDLFKCVAPLTTTYWSDSFSE